jgi:hypothetical protein
MAKKKRLVDKMPNPNAKRFPIVDACLGGQEYETIEKGKRVTKITEDCDKILDGVCISYENPAALQRLGCPLGSNKIRTEEEIKKMNPIKYSKRKNR